MKGRASARASGKLSELKNQSRRKNPLATVPMTTAQTADRANAQICHRCVLYKARAVIDSLCKADRALGSDPL
jgi:hypothetical protein